MSIKPKLSRYQRLAGRHLGGGVGRHSYRHSHCADDFVAGDERAMILVSKIRSISATPSPNSRSFAGTGSQDFGPLEIDN